MKRILVITLALLSSLAGSALNRGVDSLVYTGYGPLSDKPVTVYTYLPTWGDLTTMDVLITFHGAERSGMNGIICWREWAEHDGFIVISPEFSKKYYKENDYQFGGVRDPETGTIRPEEQWTYSIVEPLFEYLRGLIGYKAEAYHIQGHSAGGQFVHRYLIAKPGARVDRAVACNPGSWTWCNPAGTINGSEETYTWPYSVGGTPFADEAHLRAFFARKFFVCLGSRDNDPGGKNVPQNDAALQQGDHRLMRGQSFFMESRRVALSMGLPFNWGLSIVDGIGHQGRGMVYGMRGPNGYTTSVYTRTAAYYLIFGE